LKEAGFVEGQNVIIKEHYADNQADRLPVLAGELIREPVNLIVANTAAAFTAKAMTNSVPILFTTGSDPIRDGLVGSLNRPGGNVTGVVFPSGVVGAKRLGVFRQFVPKATLVAVLVNPVNLETQAERSDIVAGAQAMGVELAVADVHNEREIDEAFTTFATQGANALLVGTAAFLQSYRQKVVALATHYRVPSCFALREPVEIGGLLSYGGSVTDAYRQAGLYAARILRGEKASDLPVMQSSKFELVINLKTAKSPGLEFHPQLLVTADEVIE
jgi:putative ABC transport system substrate-binding protein